ncbi:MAG: CAP domain-containing protein [bacterium]|nr:CAP domain-containing protein [bacterium]
MKTAIGIIVAVFAALFLLTGWIFYKTPNLADVQKEAIHDALTEIKEEILAPPPLRAKREVEGARLTVDGIVRETNAHRSQNGLPALASNDRLTAAAAAKVDDMFAYQYFAHESPSGKSAGDLAKDAGYVYILVGENLALGNFPNDVDLVQAWMDSPGHRANILHERFEEIGVFAKRGIFEGKTTWIAVQEFGTPRSACPQPDPGLKAKIDYNQDQIVALQATLDSMRGELEQKRRESNDAYRASVDEYNALVERYNALIAETKVLVDQYNMDVRRTNACIEGSA